MLLDSIYVIYVCIYILVGDEWCSGYSEFDCTATCLEGTDCAAATEVEVDNWQFAWAEEQKVACCKSVGVEPSCIDLQLYTCNYITDYLIIYNMKS